MPSRPKLLIVDDGERYVELAHALMRDYEYATLCRLPGPCWQCPQQHDCTLKHAHDGFEALEALERHRDVDVVLLDVRFELPQERLLPASIVPKTHRATLQGVEILAHLRKKHPGLPVVLMTSEAQLGYEDAAHALAADEFLTFAGARSFDARALGLLVEGLLARRPSLAAGPRPLEGRAGYRDTPGHPADHRSAPEQGNTERSRYFFGQTKKMAQLRRDAHTLARTSLPMLLLGETGTGKSALTNEVIHPATGRAGVCVTVDLASLPESLMAAELFGTTKGAFSGAIDRPGRFEEADSGTLFLDEIGNLPPQAQRMLLVALQERRITRLGENHAREVDVKVVAATHADLEARVREGTFRADLYARLNPLGRLRLSPLRERLPDLLPLCQLFVNQAFNEGADARLLGDYMDLESLHGPPRATLVTTGADGLQGVDTTGIRFVLPAAGLRGMRRHAWPGNVRELSLFVRTLVVYALADAFDAARAGRSIGDPSAIPIASKRIWELLSLNQSVSSEVQPVPAVGLPETVPASPPSAPLVDSIARPTLREVSQDLERALYLRLFRETGGDFDAMARRLLVEGTPARARKVRLRFNQLGLKVRELRRSGP